MRLPWPQRRGAELQGGHGGRRLADGLGTWPVQPQAQRQAGHRKGGQHGDGKMQAGRVGEGAENGVTRPPMLMARPSVTPEEVPIRVGGRR